MTYWDDTDEDPEEDWPDESDDELDAVLVACPACGAEIYEDAVRCPICGEYVTHSHSAWRSRPAWWIIVGIAGVIATIIALTFLL